MFSDTQKHELQAPLNIDNVKSRSQSGRNLSYIEGWKAIEEANRIFGFDAWTRETCDIRCVAEHARKIGKAPNQRDGWGISYIAKVRVVVNGGIVREGVGAGHGIDADCGLAHESAIKEAETDAMKRAMMTFGNPFGLALYDKAQANVQRLPKKDAREVYQKMQKEIEAAPDHATLRGWGEDNKERIGVLPEDWQEILRAKFHERVVELRQLGPKALPAPDEPDEAPDHDADGVIWDDPPATEAEHSKWATLSPVKQAAIRCNEPAFWRFLAVANAETAAEEVRHRCNVQSRAELATSGVAGSLWKDLDAEFIAWKHADPSPAHAASPAAPIPSPPGAGAAGSPEEDESERHAQIDRELTEAAGKGWAALKARWESVSDDDAVVHNVAMRTRHKPMAKAADAG